MIDTIMKNLEKLRNTIMIIVMKQNTPQSLTFEQFDSVMKNLQPYIALTGRK